MAGFDDAIAAAMPFLATEKIDATAGATWEFSYDVRDGDGALIDMTTGFTGVATVVDSDGVEVVAPAVTFPAAGRIKCTVTAANTTGLTPGHYEHEVEVTRTSDSATIKVVGGGRATFTILGELV